MTRTTLLKISLLGLLLAILWLAAPIYGFYSHQGEMPLPPWGWETPDGEAPVMQTVSDPAYAEAGREALAAMAAHRAGIQVPGISAAVAINGRIVWQGAAGWADIEAAEPVTPETVFRVGSTSKALTATALARLVQQGTIDLNTPIEAYFDGLPNDAWAGITPLQLASHRAGLPHYGDNRDWIGYYRTGALQTHYADVRDALDIFDGSPLLHAPGSMYSYSSLGTVLLGAVMSEAAGKPYRQIMEEEVFAPRGMDSTFVAPPDSPLGSNLAAFYYKDGNRFRPWRPVDLSHRLPGGGWASTPADLVRAGMGWLDPDYISPELRDLFWTPLPLPEGATEGRYYGIGWRWIELDIDGVGSVGVANHGGVSRGAQSMLLVIPDYDMAVAFNINTNTEEFGTFSAVFSKIFRPFAIIAGRDAARAE